MLTEDQFPIGGLYRTLLFTLLFTSTVCVYSCVHVCMYVLVHTFLWVDICCGCVCMVSTGGQLDKTKETTPVREFLDWGN